MKQFSAFHQNKRRDGLREQIAACMSYAIELERSEAKARSKR